MYRLYWKNDHLWSFFNIIYTFLGSIFEPCYFQNRVITNHVIKRLQCTFYTFSLLPQLKIGRSQPAKRDFFPLITHYNDTWLWVLIRNYLARCFNIIMGLTYTISMVNWICLKCFNRNCCFFFFTAFKLILMIRNNIVKISETLNMQNSLKISKLPTP